MENFCLTVLRQEVQDQGASRQAWFFLRAVKKYLFHVSLQLLVVCQQFLAFLALSRHNSSPHMAFSLFLFLSPNSPFFL